MWVNEIEPGWCQCQQPRFLLTPIPGGGGGGVSRVSRGVLTALPRRRAYGSLLHGQLAISNRSLLPCQPSACASGIERVLGRQVVS